MKKLIVIPLLFSASAFGAENWPLEFFTSDPKAVLEAAGKVVAPAGANAIIIDDQLQLRINKQGRATHVQRWISRVITDRGVTLFSQISQVKMTWRKDEVKMRARVITPDGQSHLLDQGTISETGIPTQLQGVYSDMKQMVAPLPAVSKGSVVEAEFEITSQETLDPAGPWNRWSLPVELPVAHFSALIETPQANPARIAWRGIAGVQKSEESDKGMLRIRLTASDLPAMRTLPLAPPEMVAPEIAIATAPSWQHVAAWYSDIVEQQIGIPSPRGEGNSSDRAKQIDAILADVQSKVRYTGVELGMSAYVPRTPAETLERGYGDCKDKAVLLVNRLRADGINAQVALVTPFPFAQVFTEAPGIEAFNHAIVYIPGKRALWIDPTSEFTPASRLPFSDEGRLALIIDPKTTELMRTPESTASQNRLISRYEIALTEDGAPNISQTVEPTGALEDANRGAANVALQAPDERKTEIYDQVGKNSGIGKIASIDWGAPKDLSHREQIILKGEKYERAGGSEQLAYAFISAFGYDSAAALVQLSAIAANQDRKKEDVVVPMASSTEERWRVIPPPGFRLKQTPLLKDIDIGPLTLRRTASVEMDGSVTFLYQLENSRKRFTMAEIRKISDDWSHLSKEPAIRVDFVPEGSQLMAEGKWKEGIERLRRDAETLPRTLHAQFRYASAMLLVGLRDKAIEIYRVATQLDPKSSEAWEKLSIAYRYDPAGRMNKAGMDRDQAEQAIQTAIRLGPKEPRYIADLALTKEWRSGQQFEEPAELDEVIGLLDNISKDLPGMGLPDALPEALLHARRFGAGKQFYSREEAKTARADLKLAIIAAADGVADSLLASESLSQTEDERKTILRQAAQYLLAVGEYSKSAELLSAGSNGSAPLSDIDLLRRTRRRGDAALSKNAVIAIVQRAIYDLLDPALWPEFRNLMSPEWQEVGPPGMRGELLGILTPYSRVSGLTLGSRAMADVVVSTIEFSVDGSDESGYRVRFADPASNGVLKTIAWVVRRNGDYRILGFRNDVPTTGGEALVLAQKGDLDGARRWLDWQREEMRMAPATSSDPLGGDPLFRLWLAMDQSADSILATAAGLTAQGPHYQQGIGVLKEVRRRAKDSAFASNVEQVLGLALTRRGQFEEALPIFQGLHKRFPASETGFTSVGRALLAAGKVKEALELSRTVEATSPLYTEALRMRARVAEAQGKYTDLTAVYRELSAARNISASDWNDMAWGTLFAPGAAEPNLEWAQKAVQLSQGQSLPMLQTLASVQAELGRLKEAREAILRYIGDRDPLDPGTFYVMGRMAEQLGFADEAIGIYARIPKPERTDGVALYDLAKIRIAAAEAPPK